jgi:hypothetical protein
MPLLHVPWPWHWLMHWPGAAEQSTPRYPFWQTHTPSAQTPRVEHRLGQTPVFTLSEQSSFK